MASGDIVKLNVGGTVFQTTRSTLTKYDGYFRRMFESGIQPTLDEAGCIFIDRSPGSFELVLNFLRDGDTPIPESEFHKKQLLKEAEYYTLDGLIHLCGGEASEEWKRANLDTKYLRDWRGANMRAEIRYSSDEWERRDFWRYCKDKPALMVNYSFQHWGDIQENPHVLNFVKKNSANWHILFIPLNDKCPKCIISRSIGIITCGTAVSLTPTTCKKFLAEVEKLMARYFQK